MMTELWWKAAIAAVLTVVAAKSLGCAWNAFLLFSASFVGWTAALLLLAAVGGWISERRKAKRGG